MAQHVERRPAPGRRRRGPAAAARARRASRRDASSAACRAARPSACRCAPASPPARRRSSRRSCALFGRHADHRERAALALAHHARTAPAIRARSPARSAPGSRCTRSPSAPGRSPRAAPCAGRSGRRGRRRRPARGRRCEMPPAPTSWIARIGFALAERPAMVDDLLRAALDLRVAALHRVEVELGGVGAGGHRAGGAAAHADAHARAAELDQQRAGGELDLLRLARGDRAQAAGDHDRLVVAAPLPADRLLVDAEVAGRLGRPNSLLKAAPPSGPSIMICSGLAMCSGLP